MGLFNKEPKTETKTIKELEKELEKAKKLEEEQKRIKEEAKLKKQQKDQMNETEDIDTFIDEDSIPEIDENVIFSEISKMLESSGVEATLNYLDSIKNNIICSSMQNNEEEESENLQNHNKDLDEDELPEQFE